MTTDEINLLIQSLQDQIKKHQEAENEVRHELEVQLNQQRELSSDNAYLRQKLSAIQFDNSNYSNVQARLETRLYAQEQDNLNLRKEIQQLTKSKKDIEKKLITESEEYENDKSAWQQREADLYNQIRSLSVNSLSSTPRTPRRRSVTSTTFMTPFTSGLTDIGETSLLQPPETEEINERPIPKLAVIDSSYAREAKIAQRTIKAQDKLILDLKTELEKQKGLLQEHLSDSQLQSLKLVHLEHELTNVKQLNRSLQEDNESYQILLHEKTMNGEFISNPIMQVTDLPDMKESSSTSSCGLNLAEELASSIPDWNSQKESESDRTIQKLTEDNKMLQDTNRALQLYMNKILMKIINNKQLEDVLSIDQPTPPSLNRSLPELPKKTEPESPKGHHRRRTISYWGSKTLPPPPPPPPAKHDTLDIPHLPERRHSLAPPKPERSVSSTTYNRSSNSGWAKALRRMSGMGWSSPKEEEINNDSAVGLSEEEGFSCRKSSGSSTPSLNNELTTLNEE